jgi:hypothetical protein
VLNIEFSLQGDRKMKKFAVCGLMALMALGSALAGPIKGLVDVGTGKEVPDADLRYLLVGVPVLYSSFAGYATNAGTAATAGYATNETLQTITARGSNTTQSLFLNGASNVLSGNLFVSGASNVIEKLYVNSGVFPLSAYGCNLGSLTLPFGNLYMKGSTIYMDGVPMISVTNGEMVVAYPIVNSNGVGYVVTNLFTGAGTTGLVSSVAANTNQYLRGDGTWQTIAADISGSNAWDWVVANSNGVSYVFSRTNT